ncbi:FG-GAP repeat domain-containing protein [Actinoallomurus sp. CA-142502]|uniref:FG-GAP repeat domain-containing protein n=1 Tax=Actinoallomurus sp. CA-142502 TaxID=3239885 RepID=UPI003D8D26B4
MASDHVPQREIARLIRLAGGVVLLAGAFVPGLAGAAGAQPIHRAATCSSTSPSDFNGDGFTDVAVGEPGANVGAAAQAGVVHVRYGVAGKTGGGEDTTVTQADTGETAEAGDRFGSVLAVGYVDGDGCADLVVGVPDEDVGSAADAGVVQVIYGSPDGLGRGEPSRVIRPGADGVPGTAAAGDRFGAAVDVSGPGFVAHAMVVGAPGRDIGTATDAGQVTYVPFVSGHPGTAAAISQDSPGVTGAAESGDHFGAAVALSGVKGSSTGIAVGAPDEDIGTDQDAGSVTAIPDPADATMTSYAYNQDSAGFSGAVEPGDRFGASLSSAFPSTDGPLLAIGVPGEDIGTIADAGMVHVLLTKAFTEVAALSQDTPEVLDQAEAGDRFGAVVALGREQAFARLLVGIPGEDHGGVADSGAVQEFSVGDPTENAFIEQETFGGVSEPGDHFGAAVAYAGSRYLPTMIIGVPDDRTEPAGVVYTAPSKVDGDVDPPPPTDPQQKWTATDGTGYGAAIGATVS